MGERSMFVQEFGDPKRTTVVLLHGIPGVGSGWERVARALADGHHVLVPDLVGFGRSSRARDITRLDAAAQAFALDEALSRLDVVRAAIVGHDFGGPVALELHRRRPGLFTHLGLLATNVFPDTPIPFPLSAIAAPVVGGVAARVLLSGPAQRGMLLVGAGRPRPRFDLAASLGDRGQRLATRVIFCASLRELHDRYAPLERELSSIRVPTLVAWGDGDPFFPLTQGARTAAAIPQSRFVTYSRAGHFLPEERPQQLVGDISALLDRAPAEPRAQGPDRSPSLSS